MVRRWRPDTLLNGHAFTDAELSPGDRISIGTVEIEVLRSTPPPHCCGSEARPDGSPDEPGLPPSESPPKPNRQEDLLRRQEALQHQQKISKERLAETKRQGHKRTRRMIEQLRQARLQIEQLQDRCHDSGRRADELAEAQAALEEERRSLALEHRQWENDRANADAEAAEQTDRLDAGLAELELRKQEFQAERKRWETESKETEHRLNEETAKLELQQKDLEDDRKNLRLRCEELEAERVEVEKSNADSPEEIDTSELDARQSKLEARAVELDSRQAELQAGQVDFKARQAELDAKQADFDTSRAEFDAQRQEFLARCENWEAEQAETEQRLSQRVEELTARQSEVDTCERDFRLQRDQWEAQHTESEDLFSQQTDQVDDRPKPGSPEAPDDETPDVQFQQPSADSPASSADIFRRLGTTPLLPDGEEEEYDSPNMRSVPVEPPGVFDVPEPAGTPRGSGETDDEESVDDYMRRLLARVKSTGKDEDRAATPRVLQPKRTAEAPKQASITEAESSTPKMPAIGPERCEPVELSPRAVAPENDVNLAAMRELANLSARTAIDSHAKNLMSRSVGGKLMVSIVGLVVGANLTWLWWVKGTEKTALLAAATSLVVGVGWGAQYLVLSGQMILSRRRKRCADQQSAEADTDNVDETDRSVETLHESDDAPTS